jgi:putative phosphoribosyl transferase
MDAIVNATALLIVRNADVIQMAGIKDADFKAECHNELAEIERCRPRYLRKRERTDVTGHTAIVVDDGIATGVQGEDHRLFVPVPFKRFR